jgi:hypothetical protein
MASGSGPFTKGAIQTRLSANSSRRRSSGCWVFGRYLYFLIVSTRVIEVNGASVRSFSSDHINALVKDVFPGRFVRSLSPHAAMNSKLALDERTFFPPIPAASQQSKITRTSAAESVILLSAPDQAMQFRFSLSECCRFVLRLYK